MTILIFNFETIILFQVLSLIYSPEFEYDGGYTGDQFLLDSFLAADSKVNLTNFRDMETETNTKTEAFLFMRG